MKATRLIILSVLPNFIFPAVQLPLFAQTPVQKTIQVTTQVQTSPPVITFTWQPVTGASGFQIYRKTKDAVSWGVSVSSLPGSATTYSDTSVTAGEDYEYRIYSSGTVTANTYLYAGIDVPQTDDRGKIILLVDSMLSIPLETEIGRLINNIKGDGWQVIRYEISRYSTPPVVKSIIQAAYNADPLGVRAVFLLGHIPVPYSGFLNPDGHPDHKGAWPADGYYGDFTTNWTDITVNDTTASRLQNRNVPGDGKFDQSVLSNQLQLQIGRVDLANMPAFSANETVLMKQYLDKNHDFRHKVINPERRALIDDNFGYFSGEAFATGGWRNFTAIFPPQTISAGDYFTDMSADSYLWSYGCGAGSYTNCSGVGNTTAFASNAPRSVFTMLFGSYFGDWDSQNNLLRAPLASAGWGLTSSWSGRPHHIYHHMSLGENAGYAIWRTMRNTSTYETGYGAGFVNIALMGDPTLRMHVVHPPSNLLALFSQSMVDLSWDASADTVEGYHIYRMDKATGQYQRITQASVTGLSFTDTSPGNSTNHYMVRAVKLEYSNSGTYHNLSQGVFDSVQTNIGMQGAVSFNPVEFRLWPNPASSCLHCELVLRQDDFVNIRIYDLTGREVEKICTEEVTSGRHHFTTDLSSLTPGTYFCTVITGSRRLTHKIIRT